MSQNTTSRSNFRPQSAPEERKKEYLEVAEGIAETCWRMYNITQTGLGAEYVVFDSSPNVDIALGARHNLLRPEAAEALFYAYRATHNETYRDWGWMMFQVMLDGVPWGVFANSSVRPWSFFSS